MLMNNYAYLCIIVHNDPGLTLTRLLFEIVFDFSSYFRFKTSISKLWVHNFCFRPSSSKLLFQSAWPSTRRRNSDL